jgi:hypothetical protein
MRRREALTSWVKSIDIEREVDGPSGPHAVSDLLDDAVQADGVNLAGLHDLEATVSVVLVVAGPAQGGADTGVDVGVVGEQAFLRSVVEVCTMVDASHLARGSTKDLGLPGVEMGVEVDDGDRTVSTVDGAEEGEGDGVVSTEGDNSGKCLSVLCWPLLLGVGCWRARQDGVVPLFNLVESPGVVVSAIPMSEEPPDRRTCM